MTEPIDEAWEDYKARVFPHRPGKRPAPEYEYAEEEARQAFAAGWGALREHLRVQGKKLTDLMKSIEAQQKEAARPIVNNPFGADPPPSEDEKRLRAQGYGTKPGVLVWDGEGKAHWMVINDPDATVPEAPQSKPKPEIPDEPA